MRNEVKALLVEALTAAVGYIDQPDRNADAIETIAEQYVDRILAVDPPSPVLIIRPPGGGDLAEVRVCQSAIEAIDWGEVNPHPVNGTTISFRIPRTAGVVRRQIPQPSGKSVFTFEKAKA